MSDWNRNEIAYRVQVTPGMLADSAPIDFMAAFKRAEDVRLHPWKAPDRNPMPSFAWWPWIDRAIWWRAEAPKRLRGALNVLRDGVSEGDDW